MAPDSHTALTGRFVCTLCGKEHLPGQSEYTCLICGPAGILEALPRPWPPPDEWFTSSPGIWRYERLLALSSTAPRPPLPVGATPLLAGGRLSTQLNLPNLFLKNDALNPTGSLKDRASAVALARAAELGVARVAVASTGNAGSSLAGLAASMGIPAVIFVPEKAPAAKLVQALAYGAQVFAVRGGYDDAFDLCARACTRFGWYNRSTALNPYTIEGKKTVAFELYEQLGNRAPDIVFVPTGDGCILSGAAKGFRDLQQLGRIERVPRLIAVQAEGSAAIAHALRLGRAIERISAASLADSITVDLPRNGAMALRDLRACGGQCVVVSDAAILAAIHELAATTGIFAEPAAAASLAGLRAWLPDASPEERASTIVLLITGSGLKDTASAARAAPRPIVVDPSLDAVEAALPAQSL